MSTVLVGVPVTQLQVEYVTNTSSFPWSAVVQIQVDWTNGSSTVGSGAVVGPNDVLTAAHVVYEPARGSVESIQIIPGRNGSDRPFGTFSASGSQFFEVGAFKDTLTDGEVRKDVALLTVENPTPIGETTGWFGIRSPGLSDGQRINLNSAGYPTSFASDGPRMVRTFDDELFVDGLIRHDINDQTGQGWGGHSGAPYFVLDDGGRFIVAVHSTSGEAAYINSSLFSTIAGWIKDNDDSSSGGGGGGDTGDGDGGGGGDQRDPPPGRTKIGDDGANRLVGGAGNDRLEGRGGQDVLIGRPGDDRLFGGKARDDLRGGSGDDLLRGEGGGDQLFGGKGDDRLIGGGGRDLLRGQDGNDVLKGGGKADNLQGAGGSDRLVGGAGNDRMNGGGGVDALFGGKGGDRLKGGAGDDVLQGGTGRDRIDGDRGYDIMTGGGGADTFIFDARDTTFGAGTRSDEIRDFQPGLDQLVFRNFTQIDLQFLASATNVQLPGESTSVPGTEVVFPGFGGASVTLVGVLAGDLSNDDLIYL